MRRHLFGIILVLAQIGFAPAVFAQGEGTAVGVNPDAVARVRSQERILQVGTDVSVGELLAKAIRFTHSEQSVSSLFD